MTKQQQIKELQAELEHRQEIENQAIDLIAKGDCQQANSLLNTLDDDKLRKIIANSSELDFQSKEVKNGIDCLMQHLDAFLKQARNKEIADFGKPCSTCKQLEECKADWIERIKPIETKVEIKLYNTKHQAKENDVSKEIVDIEIILHAKDYDNLNIVTNQVKQALAIIGANQWKIEDISKLDTIPASSDTALVTREKILQLQNELDKKEKEIEETLKIQDNTITRYVTETIKRAEYEMLKHALTVLELE